MRGVITNINFMIFMIIHIRVHEIPSISVI